MTMIKMNEYYSIHFIFYFYFYELLIMFANLMIIHKKISYKRLLGIKKTTFFFYINM